jgi:ATP-dependent Clp protease adapter protein ClpS
MYEQPEKETESQTELERQYRVWLFDDDIHTAEFVSVILRETFGWTEMRAWQVLLKAEKEGMALCITTDLESAEYFHGLLSLAGLTALVTLAFEDTSPWSEQS